MFFFCFFLFLLCYWVIVLLGYCVIGLLCYCVIVLLCYWLGLSVTVDPTSKDPQYIRHQMVSRFRDSNDPKRRPTQV